MNTQSNKNYSALLLLAGTLLVGFSMGRWLAPLASWIGPVLIMRFSRDHKPGRGYFLVLAACSLSFLIGFGSNWASQFPLPVVPIIGIFYGFLWSLPYLADRLAGPRLRGFSSTLVYPLAVTALEFVNTQTNPIGTWGATGFTQYGVLLVMQLASITGMIGITFLMGWFASVVNWAWENRIQGKEMLRGLAIFGVFFVAVFLFGFLRLNFASTGETVRVAGITSSPTRELFGEDLDADILRSMLQTHWDAYFSETVREARAGAKAVVWPEISAVVLASDEASLIARAQEIARQNEIYLTIPLFVGPDDLNPEVLKENKLLLIDPTGAIVMEHIKYGGYIIERYRIQGDGNLQSVDTPFGILSGVICWDMDYPTILQQAGQNGTALMLVPSSDWYEVNPLHAHMAVFRAIENGMSMVRQVEGGLSIAVDPYGRVLSQTDYFSSTDRTMVAQVPVKHVDTIYSSFGRWFGWVCFVGFLVLVAYVVAGAMIERKQMKSG